MSYQSHTIATAVMNRLNVNYLLPAIQREFVWGPEQIVELFDSIMRGYPISSFLVWELKPENQRSWQAYRFVEHAQWGGTHNQPTETDGIQQLTLILDGQQRFTSMMVGLRGTYTTKKKYMRWSNPNAWVQQRLYLDLFKDPEDESDSDAGLRYGFRFMPEAPESDAEHYWFKVGQILDFDERKKYDRFRMEARKSLLKGIDTDRELLFEQNLDRLYQVVWGEPLVWYYTEHDQDYDRVLDIFIRANEGGTVLSKSDLLLSTVVAKWEGVNAREEIYGFVDWINTSLTRKNNFDKDFIMKSCLVLSDLPVQYKVQNFNNENLDKIFQRWSGIKRSVEAAVDLANTFGIDRDTLTSRNALIPLAYYFLLHDLKLRSNSAFDVKNAATVRKWLTTALLNNVFGGASDNVLRDIREVLKAQGELTADFPADEISKVIERRGRAAYMNDGTVDELLSITYGGRNAFLALSLLYEGNNWGTMTFHQDHIFPRALFSERNLNALGFSEERKARYRRLRDRFGNLQLLLSDENLEKQDKDFGDWIRTRDEGFKQRHLIPEGDGLLDFGRFEDFMTARENLIRNRLKNLLYVEQ